MRQAEEQKAAADATVTARLPETFQWLLVPVQANPESEFTWQDVRLQGSEGLAVRASARLVKEEQLLTRLAGTSLRLALDRVPLWRGDHVSVSQLIEDFARYVYLPRLKGPAVLLDAVRDGVAHLTWEQETFAYADGFDEASGRYLGLRAGQQVAISGDAPQGLVVKPEAPRRQRAAESVEPGPAPTAGTPVVGQPIGAGPGTGIEPPAPPRLPTRFHGTVSLDPIRAGADAGKIAEEILTHLVNVPGARVQVTLEIEATAPEGVPENVVRIVTENARTLKFRSHGFESE